MQQAAENTANIIKQLLDVLVMLSDDNIERVLIFAAGMAANERIRRQREASST